MPRVQEKKTLFSNPLNVNDFALTPSCDLRPLSPHTPSLFLLLALHRATRAAPRERRALTTESAKSRLRFLCDEKYAKMDSRSRQLRSFKHAALRRAPTASTLKWPNAPRGLPSAVLVGRPVVWGPPLPELFSRGLPRGRGFAAVGLKKNQTVTRKRKMSQSPDETPEEAARKQAVLELCVIAGWGTAQMVEEAARPDILDEPGLFGKTALHTAADCGNEAAVATLLRLGANPNSQDSYLRTPCAVAARSSERAQGRALGAALLLAEAMAPDESLTSRRDMDRLTLFSAAQCGQLDLVKVLLPKAANPLAGDSLRIRKAAAKEAQEAGWPACAQWISGWLEAEAEKSGLKKAQASGERAAAKAAARASAQDQQAPQSPMPVPLAKKRRI